MDFKKILKNPWTKRIGLATGLGVTSILIAKKVRANNQMKMMQGRIKDAASTTSSKPASKPAPASNHIDNTLDLRSYDGMQYNTNTIVLAGKRMQFTMTGIRSMQKYMSRLNKNAARQIAMSGGIDGVIGRGFVKAYKEVIKGKAASQVANLIRALLKEAGKSEFKIIK